MHSIHPLPTIGLLCLAFAVSAPAAEYHVSPVGDDAASGSITAPFASLQHVQEVVVPGDTVWIRGGTYVFDDPTSQGARYLTEGEPDPGPGINNVGVVFSTSGTEEMPIRYLAWPGEVPVFDFFAYQPVARIRGFSVQASHLHLKGIEMKGVQQIVTDVNESWCVRVEGATNPSHNVLERFNCHHNEGPGIFIKNGAENLVLNCDSHHNWDPDRGGENADGFGSHSDLGGNRFVGTRAWENSDDGYDCINSPGQVTFENCWAWRNGWIPGTNTAAGNGGGIKAGGFRGNLPNPIPRHAVVGCLAWGNRVWGINANGHQGPLEFLNNTAFGNPRGFDFFDRSNVAHFARNNISHGNGTDVFRLVEAVVDDEFNTWNPGFPASAGDFRSTSASGADGPRGAGGELPVLDFMRLAAGSGLIDTGQDVGRPFRGEAPDLGAFESGGMAVPGIRVVRVATANTGTGSAASITIPNFQMGGGNTLVVIVNSECSTIEYSVIYQTGSGSEISLQDGVFEAEGSQGAGIYWMTDPGLAGTTGDVVIQLGGSSAAAVSVLSLGQVLGVVDSATAKGTSNANLLLDYDGVAGGLVLAGGVDNAFSGATPSWSGAHLDVALQSLATDFGGGSAGFAQSYGSVSESGAGFTAIFDPAGSGSSSRNAAALVSFATSVPATYDAWLPGFDWGGADSTPTGDANADGIGNLLCYALGVHPLDQVASGMLPRFGLDSISSGGPWLFYEFRENVLAGDVAMAVEVGESLASDDWSALVPDGIDVISEIANPDPDGDGATVLHRIRLKPAGGRRFLRLRAVLSDAP